MLIDDHFIILFVCLTRLVFESPHTIISASGNESAIQTFILSYDESMQRRILSACCQRGEYMGIA